MTNWLYTVKSIIGKWSCQYYCKHYPLFLISYSYLELLVMEFDHYTLVISTKPLYWLLRRFDITIFCGKNLMLTCAWFLTEFYIPVSRFKDWKSFSSSSIEHNDSTSDGFHKKKVQSCESSVSDESIRNLSCRSHVLHPQGPTLQKWNKIFVITSVLAISVDPLFFYIPVIDDSKKCLDLDGTLKITASVLRTFFDLLYILHIIFQFRTGFIAPSSRVFGRGELVDDPSAIVMKYLSSYFTIDILSIIPLPQVFLFSSTLILTISFQKYFLLYHYL